MNKEQISEAVSEYRKQERFEIANRESYRDQINNLESLIQSSYEAPIYSMIYKKEYGDYRQFVQIVSQVLRLAANDLSETLNNLSEGLEAENLSHF